MTVTPVTMTVMTMMTTRGGGEVHSIQKVILPEYRSVHHFQAHRHLPFHPATQTHGHTLHQRKTVDVISND